MCFPLSSNWKILRNQFSAGGLEGLGTLGGVLRVYAFAPLRFRSDLVAPALMLCLLLIWQIPFSVQHLRATLLSRQGYRGPSWAS